MQGAAGYPDAVGDQRGGAWQPPGARPGQNEGTEYKTPFAEQIIGLLLLCYTSSGCVKMVVFRFRILERSVEMCEQERSASRKSITR